MTAVNLDALEAARAAATAGEWTNNSHPWRVDGSDWVIARTSGTADAALIVAAVNALPDLLAAVRERDALRAAVEKLADEFLVPVGFEVTHYRDGLRDAGRRIHALLAAVDGAE